MRQTLNYFSRAGVLSFALLASCPIFADNTPASAAAAVAAQPTVFAKIGAHIITLDEYNAAYALAARGKFYHGKPPESEVALLQREVSDKLVERVLFLNEARQRGLLPDAAAVQKTVQTYEQRYAASEQWKKNRAQALPPLVARLEQEDLLSQLEKSVRASATPPEAQVRAYYEQNKAKFTEPEQLRVSVILLKVDPSATSATWQKAHEQAQALAKRARAGEDFAALAREYSVDGSAPQGGDMGYLHGGMLPEGIQEGLGKLTTGEISEALRMLEGFSVFQLTGRKLARLQEFDVVKVRAQDLMLREQSDRAWAVFIADLKTKTPLQIDQSRFLPLSK